MIIEPSIREAREERAMALGVRPRSFGCGVLLAAFFLGGTAAAQTYKAETFSSAAPQELSAAVRETLADQAIRVVGPNGLLCEIWLRKIVPARAGASQELGIAYGQLEEGTLMGAIRFLSDGKDYRRQPVKPGVYTLRYALHPVDGNHMGVSPYRDFLLLSPAAADPNPAPLAMKDLIAQSRKASGTGHPSVWSLIPTEGASGSPPSLAHKEDEDHWVLSFRVELQAGTASPSTQVMSLVVVGSTSEA